MDFDFLTETITPTQTTTVQVAATGALGLPYGTTAQRVSPATAGWMRWNSDTPGMETWNGSAWVASAGSGTVTSVAVSGSTGLGVSGSPITTSGTITLTLGTELQGLSGLAATGIIARTGAGTYSSRTITGTAGNVTVSNGDGVSGNPTIDLATAGSAITDQLRRITTDAYGRVTASSAPTAGDITTALTFTPVNKAGDTGVGAISFTSGVNITVSGGGTITGLPTTPVGSTDAASKAYVDSISQGLDPKASVRVATTVTGTLATAYENGDTIDGITLATNDRILIKNQSSLAENGIYIVNASGAPTRATDMDNWLEVPNAFIFVEVGTVNADTGWVCTSDAGGTLNTTAITFVQFAGAGSYSAGTGLTLTGTVFSITSPIATSIGGTGLGTIGTANQVLGVNNGASGLEYKTITAGTAIGVVHAANSITINNSGVTSAVAGTGIGVSGATGAVTISNTGVTAIAGTSNQVTLSGSTGSVTVSTPSTFTAPGYVAVTTGLYESTSAAVSAAGSTQGTATALTASYNVVTTVGASAGVVLPVPTLNGWRITIVNRGANSLTIYPNSGGALDGASTNAGVQLAVNSTVTFQNSSSTQWFNVKPSLVAGTGTSVTYGNGITTIANTGVTSVALSLGGGVFTVSGSPVTTTGTLTGTLASQSQNTVFAAPSGSAGSPTFRALVYSDLPLRLYVENPSSPTTPVASANNSWALGSGSTASGVGSSAVGDGTNARIAGATAFANGKFVTAGDAQSLRFVLRNSTTTATPTELFLDGSSARAALLDNSQWTFRIDVTGRRTDATGGSAGYTFTGVMKRDSGVATTAVIGSISKTVIAETNTSWDCGITADTTNGSIKVTVTGEGSKTIRWVATAYVTEVTN